MTAVHNFPTQGMDCVLFLPEFRITGKIFCNYNVHGVIMTSQRQKCWFTFLWNLFLRLCAYQKCDFPPEIKFPSGREGERIGW